MSERWGYQRHANIIQVKLFAFFEQQEGENQNS